MKTNHGATNMVHLNDEDRLTIQTEESSVDEGEVPQPCLYQAPFSAKDPGTKLPHLQALSARCLDLTYVQQDLGKL